MLWVYLSKISALLDLQWSLLHFSFSLSCITVKLVTKSAFWVVYQSNLRDYWWENQSVVYDIFSNEGFGLVW